MTEAPIYLLLSGVVIPLLLSLSYRVKYRNLDKRKREGKLETVNAICTLIFISSMFISLIIMSS